MLQRNRLVSLEKWLEKKKQKQNKTQLWRNKADTAFGRPPDHRSLHDAVVMPIEGARGRRLGLHAYGAGRGGRKTKRGNTKPRRTPRARGVPLHCTSGGGPAAPGPPVNQGQDPVGVSAPTPPPRPVRSRGGARTESARHPGAASSRGAAPPPSGGQRLWSTGKSLSSLGVRNHIQFA